MTSVSKSSLFQRNVDNSNSFLSSFFKSSFRFRVNLAGNTLSNPYPALDEIQVSRFREKILPSKIRESFNGNMKSGATIEFSGGRRRSALNRQTPLCRSVNGQISTAQLPAIRHCHCVYSGEAKPVGLVTGPAFV